MFTVLHPVKSLLLFLSLVIVVVFFVTPHTLAQTITSTVTDGKLSISVTSTAGQSFRTSLDVRDGMIKIAFRNTDTFEVIFKDPDSGPFPAAELTEISFSGGEGNDVVFFRDLMRTEFPDLNKVSISGRGGNDTIDGVFFELEIQELLGDAGNDTIVGGAGNDTIDGGTGDDFINSFLGNDIINGGDGNDTIEGGKGDDTIEGGLGNDYILGMEGVDTLRGGDGDDTIEGGDDPDTIDGGDGVDVIAGGGGNDTIDGGSNPADGRVEELSGGEGDDTIRGGDGTNYLNGGPGNDILIGGNGKDNILGEEGNDVIEGNNGNDTLNGNDGDDIIDGGGGNDILFGDTGIDRLIGGPDEDTLLDNDDHRTNVDGGDGQDIFGFLDRPDDKKALHIIKNFLSPISKGNGSENRADSFDIVTFAPNCCTGPTVVNVEVLRLPLSEDDDEFFIDDMSNTDLQRIELDAAGGDDFATIRGSQQDDEIIVSPGHTLQYGNVSIAFSGIERLNIDAFPSFNADTNTDDVIRTVGLPGVNQVINGGGGPNTLLVNSEGQAANDTGSAVEVAGSGTIQYSNMATITLESNSITNSPPVAGADQFEVIEDEVGAFLLLDGDMDPENDFLVVSLVSQPTQGNLELLPLGGIRYTPEADFSGEDSFTYMIDDGRGGISEAMATLVVNGLNDAPDAASISSPADESTLIVEGNPDDVITIAWDPPIDPDGDALTYTWQLFADSALTIPLASLSVDTESAEIPLETLSTLLAFFSIGPDESLKVYHRVITSDGLISVTGPAASVTFTRGAITNNDGEADIPTSFALHTNYPNPFNPATTIRFDLPEPVAVRLVIYDLMGREIQTLVDASLPAGTHTARWDAQQLGNGMYFYHLDAGGTFRATRPMLLIK